MKQRKNDGKNATEKNNRIYKITNGRW